MTHHASKEPWIQLGLNYPDDKFPVNFRTYRSGYEPYFDLMEKGNTNAINFRNKNILDSLGSVLKTQPWLKVCTPAPGLRDRITLAIEDHSTLMGSQLVIGRWGRGTTFNIHGHGAGITYEMLLTGKLLNRRFKQVSENEVEFESENVMLPGDIFYEIGTKPGMVNFIHQFVTIEMSTTLHYLAEADRTAVSQIWVPLNQMV